MYENVVALILSRPIYPAAKGDSRQAEDAYYEQFGSLAPSWISGVADLVARLKTRKGGIAAAPRISDKKPQAAREACGRECFTPSMRNC
ncbi:hypothetical protein [Neorhizobium sp. S3-V5DH]|jgi:hypothetical protein|uniref:hypothetical protein n=1 Tax=Neorhizobium sp. S3-V5DH TaxID=2485166 RepID=UPI000DD6AC44|nr:hypothetical protein [Neorhizobium sp. S3-V5DH]TCV76125.1 hypothetical protein EDE09_101411 [Neorhizobium sp. S3-V5DH]